MTQEQKEALGFVKAIKDRMARNTSKDIVVSQWATIYRTFFGLVKENEKHEKFTRWLIGELIKGELDEEAVMDKLVEFGFAECDKGYITVKVEI